MSKTNETYEEILDELSSIKDHSRKIDELETKVDALMLKVAALPTTAPKALEVVIPLEKLKGVVTDGISGYFDALPDSSGLLSSQNIRKLGDAFVRSYIGELQKHWSEEKQKDAKQQEECAKKVELQGIRTVDQVAEWAPEFPVEIQRFIRYLGVKLFTEDEPAENVHKILKVIGNALLPVTAQKPPTFKAWLQCKWRRFKKYASKWENTIFCIAFFAMVICTFFFSKYLHSVLEFDRKNRIFYHKVMQDEQQKKAYNAMDSVIHTDPFYEPLRKFY